MADFYGFDLVRTGACILRREMMCYSYEDHSRNFTVNLYLNNDGEVSYHSQEDATAWHGHWCSDPQRHMMVVQFSEEVSLTNISTTVFFLCQPANPDGADEIWIGRDSCQRKISLRLLDRYRERPGCKVWQTV